MIKVSKMIYVMHPYIGQEGVHMLLKLIKIKSFKSIKNKHIYNEKPANQWFNKKYMYNQVILWNFIQFGSSQTSSREKDN